MLAPRDGSVAVVPTGTLEEGLIRSAERNGVELRFLTRATGLAHEREAGSVTLSSGASVRAGLVILADGPSDALHASLGVQRMVFPGGSMPVLGAVSKAAEPAAPPSRAEIIVHKQARADAPGSVMVMRIATADAASVLVEVPAGLTLRSAAERQAWFESHGRLVGKTADLSSPREFQLASSHADRVQLGEHVVLIGDAARTGYGPSGLGVNWALRDAARVGALVRRLGHAVDASDRQQAMRWFARETTVASLRLHQLLWSRSAHEEAGSTRAHAGTRPSLAELRRLAVPVRR
jgi:2-polyprenyl-6-methoxyphenol hydroxylase-like FAD-dependent oxidoreductase